MLLILFSRSGCRAEMKCVNWFYRTACVNLKMTQESGSEQAGHELLLNSFCRDLIMAVYNNA